MMAFDSMLEKYLSFFVNLSYIYMTSTRYMHCDYSVLTIFTNLDVDSTMIHIFNCRNTPRIVGCNRFKNVYENRFAINTL